jgi:hypothetical protein
MKAFWNNCGHALHSDSAKEVTLTEAGLIWCDEVRGVQGNYFGLIDDQERMVQFYFDEDIPDGIDDAGHLKIVLMDFPQPHRKGSYATHVTIGEVHGLIKKVFTVGADYRRFRKLTFLPW